VNFRERATLSDDLARLAAGERAAFAAVYTAVWPMVRAFACRALPQRADAEDVAQTALLKVFARASEYDSERDAVAWILGVVAWEVRTFQKRCARRRECPEEHVPERAAGTTPEDLVSQRELEAAALLVLGTLRPEDVATLEAVLNDTRPDVPRATFRKRVERALQRLRSAWSSKHGT
jgi:RNA polymerase sigma-70 factor (ECF subfamily)